VRNASERTKIVEGATGRHDREMTGLKWVMLCRLAAVVVTLGIILVTALGKGKLYDDLYPTYLVLVVVCLFNLGYLLCLGRIQRPRRFAGMQILLDVLFATALVYVNGGAASSLSWLYFACILAASTLVGASAGLVVASLATICLACVTMLTFIAYHNHWNLPLIGLQVERAGPFENLYLGSAYLLAQGLAFHLVAILSGRLVTRLKGTTVLSDELLQNINEGVIAVDPNDRIVHINREARFLLSLDPRRSLAGFRLADVLADVPSSRLVQKIVYDHDIVHERIDLLSAAGESVPVSVTGSPLKDDSGRCRGTVWMLTDLTEQQQMEQAIEQVRRMELVAQMSAGIAHEIRNPLASIRGSAQEVSEDSSLRPEISRLMQLVVRESDRINSVITEFLHFAGTRKPVLRRCNLADVLTDTVLLLEKRCPESGHRVELIADGPVFALGDPEQLKQVFLNLGRNALEAMQTPGVLRIHTDYRQNRPRWSTSEFDDASITRACVTFQDSGQGFDPADVERLFTPFYTTKTRGTGLGLAVARRIIQAHRGDIEVHSQPGIGSRFTVCLEACVQPTSCGLVTTTV